ncbi:MAG: YaiI/YqxD family protein [Paracoccaceae bacterium]
MSLFIDADACPVKAEAVRVAERQGTKVYMVCNGGIRPVAHPLVEMIYVTEGPDEADKWIAGHAAKGDVVVTADIPLAAKTIAAGAIVVKHNGELLTAANIGMVLATRDLMSDLRSADPFRQGGGPAFSKADRARFLDRLDRALKEAVRG